MSTFFMYCRALAFLIWMYGSLIIMGITLLPLLAGHRLWAQKAVIWWVKLALWGLGSFCNVRINIEGKENLPENGGLIACKHQSMADVLWPFIVWNDPALIFKKELSYIPIFGWFVAKLENVMVDRKAHATALRKMVKQASNCAEQGRPVFIFPEGTRTKPGTTTPFKPGIAALYKHLDTPCIPVALNSGLHWPAHGIAFTPGVITIRILPPIAPGLGRKEFMPLLQERIENASSALLARVRTY